MTKAIVRFGYDQYVMDAQDALVVHEILAKAEFFHRKYRRDTEGGTLFYIWPQEGESDLKSFEIVPDHLYRMAKLAGKPEEK